MKLVFLTTLLLVFITTTVSFDLMKFIYCIPCNFDIMGMPYAWHSLQDKLEYACWLADDEMVDSCKGFVLHTDLTSSWPRMYPYAVEMREHACGYFC